MQISVTGRHIEVHESVREYAQDKAGKLSRYYDRIERVEVVLDLEAKCHKAEMVVRADHKNTFVAHADGTDFLEAVDLAVDKMERQLTKHKEKFRNRKHPSRPETG
ncbi:MAG: ribosome hibernation-promoting factor, HPF/YfiA family [Planctomycetota bacterium]